MSANAPPVEDYQWELYNVDKDFSEANDLAAKEPKKLRELQDLFLGRSRQVQRVAARQQQDRSDSTSSFVRA